MSSTRKTPAEAKEKTEETKTERKGFFKGSSFRKVSITVGLVVGILIFGSIALFTTIVVMANSGSIRTSREEFSFLRELAGGLITTATTETEEYIEPELSVLDHEMLEINPDYVCWIRIDGTNIDYPVLRGEDNERYISTSFYGEPNIVGSIFMDFRNVGNILSPNAEGFLPHIILYGHNLQQGGMFSDLHRLRSSQFLEENDTITLIVHGETVNYRIFSVRVSDINDPAYFLNFNARHSFPRFANRIEAPLRATQILTLSTCTSTGNENARLIVQAYRLFD